jgi:hypothetical protein
MKRMTKKQRVVGTLSHKAWAQAVEQFHRDEAEKWRKDMTAQQERHEGEKCSVVWDIHFQTLTDAQRELDVMLLREFPDPALRGVLTGHVGRALAAVTDRFHERQSEQEEKRSAEPGSGSLIVRSRNGKRALRVRARKAKK